MPKDHQDQSEAVHTPLAPPKGVSLNDYGMIEDAVMETARGRWFLKEYARRMRAAETASLLGALQRIEALVSTREAPQSLPAAGSENTGERIGSASEKLLDVVWYMRERGFESSICEAIDTEARALGELAGELGRQTAEVAPADSMATRARLFEPKRPVEICLEVQPIEVVAGQPLSAACFDAPVSEALPMAPPSSVQVLVPDEGHPEARMAGRGVGASASSTRPLTMDMRLAALAHIDALPLSRKLALFA